MKTRFPFHKLPSLLIISLLLMAGIAGTAGCDHYEKRKAARERRMDYLNTMIDSARTYRDAKQDSVRRAEDSLAKIQQGPKP